MGRYEYLETKEGQIHERWKRVVDMIYLKVLQDPKGKKGMSSEAKREFRSKIKDELKRKKRRAFSGNIILEIDFYTAEDYPPPIQTLVKNYLDLLHKPMPEIDNLKDILFKDDSQIRILIANYHLNRIGKNEAKIEIKAYRYSHFIKDVELADRILHQDFDDDNYDPDDEKEENYAHDIEYYFEELSNLEDNNRKGFYKTNQETYELQKSMIMQRLQEQYLKSKALSVDDIISILEASHISKAKYLPKDEIDNLLELARSFIPMKTGYIEAGGAPMEKGDTKIFREKLKESINEFKKNHKILFPLLHPISIVGFHTPPKRNIADLDNLARQITPFVTEIFKPPLSYTPKSTLKHLSPSQRKAIELAQKFPENGITSYQMIQIPRKKDSPEKGSVNFFMTDGYPNLNNIWRSIDRLIDEWEN